MYISKSQTDKRLYFIEDFGIGNICPTLKDQQISYLQKNYKHLSHLLFTDESSGNDLWVQLLIGLDHYYMFITRKLIKGCWYGPIEIYSKLGWILCGKYKNVSIYQSVLN